MRVLRERDVSALLSTLSPTSVLPLLDALHDVLRRHTTESSLPAPEHMIHQPERTVLVTKAGNTSLFMPSSLTTLTGIKTVTIASGGMLRGSINLFSPEGVLQAVLNAEEVTAFRTSLAVMIPFVRWRGGRKNVLVFGAGRQAEWHVRLALLLGNGEITKMTVVNRRDSRGMDAVFQKVKNTESARNVEFEVLLKTDGDYQEKLGQKLKAADVIFCCTPATEPHFKYSDLDEKPRFIGMIGSYKPHMQEIDKETLLSGGKVYVDTKEGCLKESGELIKAGCTEEDLIELGEIQGHEPLVTERNLIFKCVGLGIMDISMAQALLKMAEDHKLGLIVDDF